MALQRNNEAASRRGEPAYRLTRKFQDGAFHYFVTATCARPQCGKSQELHWALGNEPTKIAKRFRDLGWDFEPFKPRLCICNECKEKPMADNVTQMVTNTQRQQPRVLTPPEKQRVRALLDAEFDDSTGRYLAGWSDQRIGTELDVPWSRVAELREMAYGPLREDPRFDQLRNELNDLKARAKVAEAKLTENLNDLNARIARAEAALADIIKGS